MGQVFRKETKYERIKTLEDIHRKILSKQRSAKRWNGNKPIVNVLFPQLIAIAIVTFILLWPDDIAGKIYNTLILISVVAVLLLYWKFWLVCCDRKIEQIKVDVAKLYAEKQCELKDVMNTETYNVAQELLHKYGEDVNHLV